MLNLNASMLISHLFVLLIAFSVHEFAHAWTADRFGDMTPRMNGRLTLNPVAHLDPIGSLLLLVAGFGWAKPVPINPYALQRHSSAAVMWVSLAGPISNFLMAMIAAIPFHLGFVSVAEAQMDVFTAANHFLPTVPQVLWVFVYVNLLLGVFNLIPIYPLDGEKIIGYFLPPAWQRYMDMIRPFSPIILLVLVFVGALSWLMLPTIRFLMNLLVG
jgi:Zn-dependent protease